MGYVYIGHLVHMENKYDISGDLKIGKTSTTVEKREKGITRTNSPYDYKMLKAWDCGENYDDVESLLHDLLEDCLLYTSPSPRD